MSKTKIEHPILFSTEMVISILKGKKTQTRRVVKDTPLKWLDEGFIPEFVANKDNHLSPYGYAGDKLWAREKWCYAEDVNGDHSKTTEGDMFGKYLYASMDDKPHGNWKPSIHMPREASRITLKITDIRIERLQEIIETDAISEGCINSNHPDSHVGQFRDLWDSINAERGYEWKTNPWVWVIAFERIK